MKQLFTNRSQTTVSITNGDKHVFIQTNHDSPSLIQVNTNGIHIQIRTGEMILQPQTPTYDVYEEVKPIALPGPIAPPPNQPKPLKPGFNFWPFQKSIKHVSDLPIQTTEFVRLALKWCEENIEQTKRSYGYELRYYKAKRTMGTYHYRSRKITVYVYPSLELRSLCSILIHEYAHFLYIKTQADQNEYDRLERKHGYWENAHERLSRAFESRYVDELWAYMKGVINCR
ncbi:hypothetical protein ACMH5Q_09545 [Aquirufa lenticrescens]